MLRFLTMREQEKRSLTIQDVLIISVKEPLVHGKSHNDLLEDNTCTK